jgi:N-acetyl-gamma-glutamyl-phosphate reductase
MVAGILGATGYAATELVRLLSSHKRVDRIVLSSSSREGVSVVKEYPHYLKTTSKLDPVLYGAGKVMDEADVVFAALPAGLSESFATECVKKKHPFIDMGADFRFASGDEYSPWYGAAFVDARLHDSSVYGLPELFREKIKALAASDCCIVGNPGCYPTAVSLGAFPALARGLAGPGTIIADCASGITGGGREAKREYHYPEAADTMTGYKIGSHRHLPEIARNFRIMEALAPKKADTCGPERNVIFTPHLAPMNRGILASIYIPLVAEWRPDIPHQSLPLPPGAEVLALRDKIHALYEDFYKDEAFVRVLPPDTCAATARVRGSNFCDISVHVDHTGSTLIVESAIDNMVKGAAGQAVQNMNLVLGFNESTGLEMLPAVF